MRLLRLNTLVGVAVGLGLLAPAAAHAQYTHQVKCDGKQTLPIFDKHYIKKYCGPTICPGSCFGYFPTKWTPWDAACPGADCGEGVIGYGPALPNAPGIVPTNPAGAP